MTGRLTAAAVQRVCRPRLPQDEASRAIAEFEAAVDEERLAADVPPDWALSVASRLAEDLGEPTEALRLQERAIAFGGDGLEDLARRAYLLVRAGRSADGRTAFAALRPRLAEVPASMAVVAYLKAAGLADEAIAWLDAAVRAPGPELTRLVLNAALHAND